MPLHGYLPNLAEFARALVVASFVVVVRLLSFDSISWFDRIGCSIVASLVTGMV
jgi:hypothetical protein